MPVVREYFCTKCEAPTERDDLTVKKASFFEMGVGGKSIRSRVVGHLCPTCLVADSDFQRPAFEVQSGRPVMRPVRQDLG